MFFEKCSQKLNGLMNDGALFIQILDLIRPVPDLGKGKAVDACFFGKKKDGPESGIKQKTNYDESC